MTGSVLTKESPQQKGVQAVCKSRTGPSENCKSHFSLWSQCSRDELGAERGGGHCLFTFQQGLVWAPGSEGMVLFLQSIHCLYSNLIERVCLVCRFIIIIMVFFFFNCRGGIFLSLLRLFHSNSKSIFSMSFLSPHQRRLPWPDINTTLPRPLSLFTLHSFALLC